jgi:hypothetical protein
VKYPILLTCSGDLTPPRIRIEDGDGVLIASAIGQTFARRERLTLRLGEDQSQVLATIRAENPSAPASYAITAGEDKPIGSLRARSLSLRGPAHDLCDANGAQVGTVQVEWRPRPAEPATRVPLIKRILSKIVVVLDTIYMVEIPVGMRVLEARHRRSWTTHRFEVEQLGEIVSHEELVLPTLTVLLLAAARASARSL